MTPADAALAGASADVDIAAVVKAHLLADEGAAARDLYGELVRRHQRKATRIALYYLRESAEADEAVQDAFVKAYTHLRDFEYGRSFEVWFTRILVNTCLDRVKARGRRARWMIAADDLGDASPLERVSVPRESTPEALALRRERGARLLDAIERLPERQRTVVLMSQIEGASTREVSEMTGLRETTIRVHLFRALRRLRLLLADDPAFRAAPLED
ncbi:MAG: sigma-70 family RNA polymerase sigma factor [Acidobacteria bacterium]|nr:sigma-70 family RNA polymerase sigma factor [Acidobacteriota bacterium]